MIFGKRQDNVEPKDTESTANPWSSYSDMMAALLLVFMLIMFYFVYQYLDMQEVSEKNFNEQQAQLEEQQMLLETQQEQLAEQQALVEAQKEQLLGQQAQLEEQQLLVETQQEENATMQMQLESIIGVKASIIKALTEIFTEAGMDLQIDAQTGSIAMDSNVLFDFGSSVLKPEGKAFLDSFVPLYISALLESENSDYISEIIIEGHTDTVGSYNYNLELSQKRAFEVAKTCLEIMEGKMSENPGIMEVLRGLLTANGRSFSSPIRFEDGTVDMDASRRVEFKFRLKDSEMIEEMQAILKGEAE